jgi:hypothetical protein
MTLALTSFYFFCDFFPFCDVVWCACPPKDLALVLTSFERTVKTVKKLAEKLSPLQLEPVSKSDGISSKFGEICQEFVTKHSFLTFLRSKFCTTFDQICLVLTYR